MKIPGFALLLLAVPTPVLAADGAGGGGLFSVDPGLSLWTIVVFLLVLFVLKRFAWTPILGALDAREKGIRDAIDEAQKLQADAESLIAGHRQQLNEARREAQEIVAEGRSAAERVGREIQDKARQEAERLLDRARQEIAREQEAALAKIREESVDLALSVAARVLRERLDADADRALVRQYLSEVSSPAAEA
jgi:F-type H+-transporting ATPase subunit b